MKQVDENIFKINTHLSFLSNCCNHQRPLLTSIALASMSRPNVRKVVQIECTVASLWILLFGKRIRAYSFPLRGHAVKYPDTTYHKNRIIMKFE